jgi:hypothetical protein
MQTWRRENALLYGVRKVGRIWHLRLRYGYLFIIEIPCIRQTVRAGNLV